MQTHAIPVVAHLPGVGRNLQDHLLVLLAFSSRIKQEPPLLTLTEASLFTTVLSDSEAVSSDLQFYFGGFQFPDFGPSNEGMSLASVIERPKSVERISLRSRNPLDTPIIRHNYLTRHEDMKVLLEGMVLGRELFHNRAFDDMRGAEVLPAVNVKSQEELRAYIPNACRTSWHAACTCKMGHDQRSVVDPQLRVYPKFKG